MSTPSSANTTPAIGCITTNHGQATSAWRLHGRVGGEQAGQHQRTGRDGHAERQPADGADASDADGRVPGRVRVAARRAWPRPATAPAIATASRASAQNIHSCKRDLVGAERGRAERGPPRPRPR